jgi:hypothetical protein
MRPMGNRVRTLREEEPGRSLHSHCRRTGETGGNHWGNCEGNLPKSKKKINLCIRDCTECK